jgi:hypothetical protein
MTEFFFDNKRLVESSTEVNNVNYRLSKHTGGHTLHITPHNSATDTIEFTEDDLRALYYLLAASKK